MKKTSRTKQKHPKYNLDINWAEAQQFLQLLHNNEETELRFIRNGRVLNFWGDLNDISNPNHPALKKLKHLNETGWNAYAVINHAPPEVGHNKIINPNTPAAGISDADITRINAFFVEHDDNEETEGETLDRFQNAILEPSLIIQSSTINKLHVYWFVADANPDDFQKLQIQLISQFNGDPTCKNLSRVMRIPGFWHVKNQPIRSRIIDAPGHVYTTSEIINAFKLDPDYKIYTEQIDPNYQPPAGIGKRIHRAAERLIQKVKDTDEGRHRTLQWLALSCSENNLPHAEATQLGAKVAKALPPRDNGPVPAEEAISVIDWAYQHNAGGTPWPPLPANTITTTTTASEPPSSPNDDFNPFQPARAPITIQNSGYALVTERNTPRGETLQTFTQLTNWTFTPTLTLRWPDQSSGHRGTLTINGNQHHTVDLPAKAWASRRDLLATLSQYDAVAFTNSNTDIAYIRQFILTNHQNLPTATGVQTYGLHHHNNTWTELYEDTNHNHIFYAGTPVDPGPAYKQLTPGNTNQIQQAQNTIKHFPQLITTPAALALLGYGMASAYAPRITPHLGDRLPFLYITGERESGKSSSIELLLTLTTGHSSARLRKAPGLTPYQYDSSYANLNNRLSALDEYRPGAIDDAQLRKHHDLGIKWRGSGIAAKDHAYILNSPLIVAGEGFTEDAAALSRGPLYFIHKQDRGKTDTYLTALQAPNHTYAHHLATTAANTPEHEHTNRIQKARELARQATNTQGGPRLEFALTYIAYGLLHLQTDIGHPFTNETILRTLEAGVTQTLEGGTESKSNFESFLEQLGSAANEHKDPHSILTPGALNNEIIIRVSPAVELVRRRYGHNAAVSNARMLRAYANRQPWIDNHAATHKNVIGDHVRGLRVNLEQVPERCDASGLTYLEQQLRRELTYRR